MRACRQHQLPLLYCQVGRFGRRSDENAVQKSEEHVSQLYIIHDCNKEKEENNAKHTPDVKCRCYSFCYTFPVDGALMLRLPWFPPGKLRGTLH